MLAGGGAPTDVVVVVLPALVDDDGVTTVGATVESLGFITS
jgi:hypothetical protein